ncbi:MAG: hypothetical protein WD844_13980 [Thermoleophilaceae bacterium]
MTQEQPPSEEELRAALEEEMKRIRVEDVLVQTAVTLVNVAGRKLGDGDLEQSKLGIDGARALVPLLPEEPHQAVQEALSQLQMMYARAAGQGPPPAGEPPKPEDEPAGSAPEQKPPSKLWTPPGT